MGSPISSTLAEMYLQFFERVYLKHHLETKNIIYYKIYVDDLIIIYDQTKIYADTIYDIINNIDVHLEYKLTEEGKCTTNYLNLSIQRKHNEFQMNIYRKPTFVDITIHNMSKQPHSHKMAGFHFYINRMVHILDSKQAIKQECDKFITSARNNCFPIHLIHELKNTIVKRANNTITTSKEQTQGKKWITFTCHSPTIRKVVNKIGRAHV